ncbi:MAG TPA: hypothetical protein VGC42_05290 [Kofleriaceae bacterium]
MLGTDAGGLDAAPPALPLHVSSLVAGAPDLTVATATTINTTARTINGVTSAYFVSQPPYAVLFVNALDVEAALTITGSAALIIVASDAITIHGAVSVGAVGTTAGPGAGSAGAGTVGVEFRDPNRNIRIASGGGGGGYGTAGGNGGSKTPALAPPGLGGATYGGSPADPLIGGSAGAHGGVAVGAGGGGGALQLSSAVSIEVAGVIQAGGGGGTGNGAGGGGGGGGGAGGEILLEAPTVVMLDGGVLAANGGGGGGGGNLNSGGRLGANGADGQATTTPAAGGLGGIPSGGNGGAGAAGASAAGAGASANSFAGGGGGGAGRIFVRHHASTTPALTAAVSPAPSLDATLPWSPPPAIPCFTGGTSWNNRVFDPQTSGFQLELDATPSVTGLDAVVGLSNVLADEFNDLAPTVRFNPAGVIDVRNNAAYGAAVSYPWAAGTTYHFLLTIDLLGTQPSYSVDVRPTSAATYVRLATGYQFRGQQLSLRRLANLATKIDAPAGGTLQVCAQQPAHP